MTRRHDKKILRNQKALGRNVMVNAPAQAADLLVTGRDWSTDTLDKWGDKDSLAFRIYSMAGSAPAQGSLAIDFSYSKPTIAWLKASGYKHIIGYFSQRPDKNVSRSFCEDCIAAGIKISLVGEDGAQDVLGGYDRGRMRAEQYHVQAEAIGYPKWCPIFYAIDFDASPQQLDGPIREFFNGVAATSLMTLREHGPYGGFRSIESVVRTNGTKWPWQCTAWSGGSVSGHAIMLQYPGRRFYFPSGYTSYDENEVLKPFPKWGDSPPAQPLPPVQRWGRYRVPMVGAAWATSER